MATNIYNQRFIQKRKENGLCLKCAKPLDREGVHCVTCRSLLNDSMRKDRHYYQEHGICPRCRKNKLYGDEKQCLECSAIGYRIMVTRDRVRCNEQHREWSKRTHATMIENGICTRCRKRAADNGYKTCGICRAKTREYKRMKYGKPDRRERYEQGLCYFCDEPIKDGYKVCEKHYESCVEKSRCENAKQARDMLIKNGILY